MLYWRDLILQCLVLKTISFIITPVNSRAMWSTGTRLGAFSWPRLSCHSKISAQSEVSTGLQEGIRKALPDYLDDVSY